ncbi:ABC transporter permease [Tahibacter amnicola]|uniref:ABC transporter permease n=1 Tax=Tahibacter amnicola TaxID=2976241 RepID=A0ABY6B7X0_9GAMM|nr:ABC transporter permease [Tahibacter amnicola]UXI66188.1 ABC transporter permease [Tahibacter amnicola]
MSTTVAAPTPSLLAMTRPSRLNQLRTVMANELRAYLRNRMAIFWVFIFPLLLFVMLGFAIGRDLGALRIAIVADEDAASQALAERIQFGLREATLYRAEFVPSSSPQESNISLRIHAGRDAAAPPRVVLDYLPGYSSALYLGIKSIERTALEYALERTPSAATVEVVRQARHGTAEPLGFDRFLFSGIIVLMLLSGGVLSLAYALTGQREQNILKPLALFPLRPAIYLLGVMGARLIVMVVAAVAFASLGATVFGLPMQVSPQRIFAGFLLVVAGGTVFMSIGFAIASRTHSSAAAELVGNAVYYPLLLLGDLTIPLRELPLGLERVLHWMPTNQLAAGIRDALYVDTPFQWPWTLFGYLAATSALFLVIGARAFRFRGEHR